MRLHFDFSEYEESDEPSRVLVTVTIPDGSEHSRVTEVFEKTLSMFYGYNIGTTAESQFSFNFDDDEDDFKPCGNCVQGTCIFGGCGKEFK